MPSIIRTNLLTQEGYTPYCGNPKSKFTIGGCNNPRTRFNEKMNQFQCSECGWKSKFDKKFILLYKQKWNK